MAAHSSGTHRWVAPSVGPTTTVTDPLAQLYRIAEDISHEGIRVTPTIRQMDRAGEVCGFLSGTYVIDALQQMMQEQIGPLNAQRRALLDSIPDWTVSLAFIGHLTGAVVDPLLTALAGPRARALWFCHIAAVRLGLQVANALRWTVPTIDRCRQANADLDDEWVRGTILLTEQVLNQALVLRIDRDALPLASGRDRHLKAWLWAIVGAQLEQLLWCEPRTAHWHQRTAGGDDAG